MWHRVIGISKGFGSGTTLGRSGSQKVLLWLRLGLWVKAPGGSGSDSGSDPNVPAAVVPALTSQIFFLSFYTYGIRARLTKELSAERSLALSPERSYLLVQS